MERKEKDRPREKKTRKKTLVAEKYNINDHIATLKQRGELPVELMRRIIQESSSVLEKEPNVLRLGTPLVIVGDIHGQFYDLLGIFQKFGTIPNTQYLFLGDYVDRGKFCIQVLSLILMLKINYPDNIYLLRGNHEGRTMTSYFNFRNECEKKYNSEVYEQFIDLFTRLPLCALIDNKYFAVHGGISPFVKTIAEAEKINRFCEIPEHGALCDLLWSDPSEENAEGWVPNKMRSCSYFYSRSQATKFLTANSIKLIIRGHEVQMKGFKYQYGPNNQPLTLTIFSAPRYCDTYSNKAAVAILNGKDLAIKSFKDSQHPFVLNNYLNAFDLSFPVIGMGVSKIFTHILKNPKVRKSLKITGQELELIELLKKIDNVDQIMKMLNINVNQISLLLSATQLKSTPDAMDIGENLLEFIEDQCLEANEKLPLIFGPKQVQFVKIKVNSQQEELSVDDCE